MVFIDTHLHKIVRLAEKGGNMLLYYIIGGVIFFSWLFSGVKIIRPTHRGLKERFGKYKKYCLPGFNWIIPGFDRLIYVNITEQMVDAQPQEIITFDNLNATVDAQVYFKVQDNEESIKSSQYNVFDYQTQIVSLARTTLRNIIGTLTLKSANSERDKINDELLRTLSKETKNWGMQIVRTELKQIDPPADVQETMNKVVKAENEKIAALDYANALEREADGQKRAEIKKSEGIKQGKILKAEGEAESIRLVNDAANKYFIGNAQLLKKLETVENSLSHNSKVVIPTDCELINVIGELAGVTPVKAVKSRNSSKQK